MEALSSGQSNLQSSSVRGKAGPSDERVRRFVVVVKCACAFKLAAAALTLINLTNPSSRTSRSSVASQQLSKTPRSSDHHHAHRPFTTSIDVSSACSPRYSFHSNIMVSRRSSSDPLRSTGCAQRTEDRCLLVDAHASNERGPLCTAVRSATVLHSLMLSAILSRCTSGLVPSIRCDAPKLQVSRTATDLLSTVCTAPHLPCQQCRVWHNNSAPCVAQAPRWSRYRHAQEGRRRPC